MRALWNIIRLYNVLFIDPLCTLVGVKYVTVSEGIDARSLQGIVRMDVVPQSLVDPLSLTEGVNLALCTKLCHSNHNPHYIWNSYKLG